MRLGTRSILCIAEDHLRNRKSVLSIREAFDNETCQDTFCRWSSNVLVLRQIQSPSPGIWPPPPLSFPLPGETTT